MSNVIVLPVIRIERHEDNEIAEDIDYTAEDKAWEECGRWDQSEGGMAQHCRLAGTEQCEFECPNNRNRH